MNCKEFVECMSLYIDEEMTEIEKKEFEIHILNCNKCRQEYEDMLKIMKMIRIQEQSELPDNYKFELRRKLKETVKEEKKINWKAITSVAAGLIILIMSMTMLFDKLPFMGQDQYLTKSTNDESPQRSMDFDISEPKEAMENDSVKIKAIDEDVAVVSPTEDTNFTMHNLEVEDEEIEEGISSIQGFGALASRSSLVSTRKTVKEAYLSIELDELDKVHEQIFNYVENKGGFIEDINGELDYIDEENSHLIKIRIPSENFEMTLDFLRQLGTLADENLTHVDITEKYQNVESNLRCLYEQENLLLGILYKVEDSKDKSLVEDELNIIKEEINSESLTLEEYEDSVILSTINTQLNEIGEDD
ncbi:MAG: DUF4349 domain-containing protein [Tissierellales bacterium]